jgi:hypothetical protein
MSILSNLLKYVYAALQKLFGKPAERPQRLVDDVDVRESDLADSLSPRNGTEYMCVSSYSNEFVCYKVDENGAERESITSPIPSSIRPR